MTVLDDSDYVVVKEYILFLKDELVDIFFDEQEIRSICTKTNCQIELTNRILNRKIGGFKIIKYAIIQIKGKDDFSIRQCNRLLEQRCPQYRKRQEYNKKAYCCTLFPEESLPDNAQLYFQYQRSGATKYQFGKVLLKSPFETNCRRPLNDCYWKTNDYDLKKGILVSSTKQTENYFSHYLKNNLSTQDAYKDEPYSHLYFANPVEDEERNKYFDKTKFNCTSRYNMKNKEKNNGDEMHSKNMKSEVEIEPLDNKDMIGKTLNSDRSRSHNGEGGHQLLQYEVKQIRDENSFMVVNTLHMENHSPVNESFKPLIDVLVMEEYSDFNNLKNSFKNGEGFTGSIEIQSNHDSPRSNSIGNQRQLSSGEKSQILQNQVETRTSGKSEMNVDIVENVQYNDAKSSFIDINYALETLNNVDDIYTLKVQDFSVANKYDQTNFQITVENADLENRADIISTHSFLSESRKLSDVSPKNILQNREGSIQASSVDIKPNDEMKSHRVNEMQIYMQNFITVHPFSDVTKETVLLNRLSTKGENVILGNSAIITQRLILSEEAPYIQDINYQRIENIDSAPIYQQRPQLQSKELYTNGLKEGKLIDTGNKNSFPNNEFRKSDRLSIDKLRKSSIRTKDSNKSSIISTITYSRLHELDKKNVSNKKIVKEDAEFLTRLPVQLHNTYETSELPTASSPEFRVSSSEQFLGDKDLEKIDKIHKLNVVKGSKVSDSLNGSQATPGSNNKIKVRYQVRENGKLIEDKILDGMNNESRIFTDSESIKIISDNKNAPIDNFVNDSGKKGSYMRFNANLNESETSSIHLEMVIKDTYKQYLSELPITKTEADIESPLLEIPCDNSFRPYDSSTIQDSYDNTDNPNRLSKERLSRYGRNMNLQDKCNNPADINSKKIVKCFSFTKEKKPSKNDPSKFKNEKDSIKYKLPKIDKVKPVIHKDCSRDFYNDIEHIKHNRMKPKIDNQNNRKFERSKKLMKMNDSTNLEVMLMSVNSDEETLCELSASQIISDVSNNAQKSANNHQKELRKQYKENLALETLTKLDNLSGMDLLVQQMADKLLVDISCLNNENLNYPEIREIGTESQSSETMFSMNFEIPIKNNQNSMKVKNNNSRNLNTLQLLDTSIFSDISSFTNHLESKHNILKHSFEETPMISPTSFLNNNFSNSSDCFPILVSKYFDDLNFSQERSYNDFMPLVNINKLKLNSSLQFAETICSDHQFPVLESTDFFQSISGLKNFLNENSSTKQNYSIDKIYQSQILYRISESCQITGTNYRQFLTYSEKGIKRNNGCGTQKTSEIFHTEYRKPNIEFVFEDNSNKLFHQFPKINEIDFNTTHSLRNYHCTLKLVSPRILYKYKPEGNSKIPKLNKPIKQTGPISLFHEELLNSTNQLEFYKNKSPFISIENKSKDNFIMKKDINSSRTASQQSPLIALRPVTDSNSENAIITNTQCDSSFSKITDWILRNNKYARG